MTYLIPSNKLPNLQKITTPFLDFRPLAIPIQGPNMAFEIAIGD
jgi:hypothetical protein